MGQRMPAISPPVVKWVILVTMLLTIPCFVFLLLCAGFLPVGVMGLLAFNQVLRLTSDLFWLVIIVALLVAEAAIYIFVFTRLTRLLSRFIVRAPKTGGMLMLLGVVLVGMLMFFLPIYSLDCMDGHSLKRCSAARMYFGWFGTLSDPRNAWLDAQCGDLGW